MKPFHVFDATRYANKPDMFATYGFTNCVCETWVNPWETGDQATLRWAKLASDTKGILALNNEPIPDYKSKDFETFADIVIRQVDLCRSHYQHLLIGHCYSIRGTRENWGYNPRGGRTARGLADVLNINIPDVYLHPGVSLSDWAKHVEDHLSHYTIGDRPTYCLLNTTYTLVPPYDRVPAHELEYALKFLYDRVDGVIAWGGYYWNEAGNFLSREFDANDPWVERFVAAKRVVPLNA